MELVSNKRSLESLSDDDLLHRLCELTRHSRRIEADLVVHIGEVDGRRLYTREACSSMFAFCTERLHLSEAEAFLRIAAARAAREHPVLLEMLADGRLHLSAIVRLAPHLTAENRDAVLQRAVHRSKREILELVAELSPRADVPAVIRKLPARCSIVAVTAPVTAPTRPVSWPAMPPPIADTAARPVVAATAIAVAVTLLPGDPPLCPDAVGTSSAVADAATAEAHSPRPQLAREDGIEPTARARYRVQFTASAELRDKLERLTALMRSSVPDGSLATVIEEAVTEKLARLEARRFARTKRPRKSLAESDATPSSRHVPAAVRRAVSERDGGRCAFRDAQGRRCTARERLELHHRVPYGHGGEHSLHNLALLCHAHNSAVAAIDYGTRIGRVHRPARDSSDA